LGGGPSAALRGRSRFMSAKAAQRGQWRGSGMHPTKIGDALRRFLTREREQRR